MSYESYQFLAWARKGLAAQIPVPDNLGVGGSATPLDRIRLEMDVEVNGKHLKKNLALLGPGDVVGIRSEQVVRTEPRNGIANFEPNYLPFVEFYDEDFPWRYTPAAPVIGAGTGDKKLLLRPWVALVVLTAEEFVENRRRQPLPSILVKNPLAVLPPHRELHLWAHAHSNLSDGAPDTDLDQYLESLGKKSQQDPDGLYSRLVSPRRLAANLLYHAFVVPVFEVGRLAGLGAPTQGVDAQKAAWTDVDHLPLELPVYYQWSFRTSEAFDFEYLVRLLQARSFDASAFLRQMDCTRPGFTLQDKTHATKPPVLGLEGAIAHVNFTPVPLDAQPFVQQLKPLLDSGTRRQADLTKDPVIAPPFYGWHHALRKNPDGSLNQPSLQPASTGWLHELNRDPRNRVAASAGAEVVRQNQERLMDEAWKQAPNLFENNATMRHTRLAIELSQKTFDKSFGQLNARALHERAIMLARPVAAKVKSDAAPGSATVWGAVVASALSETVCQPSFRRLARPRGPVARRLNKSKAPQATTFSMTTLWNKANVAVTVPAANKSTFKLENSNYRGGKIVPAVAPTNLTAPNHCGSNLNPNYKAAYYTALTPTGGSLGTLAEPLPNLGSLNLFKSAFTDLNARFNLTRFLILIAQALPTKTVALALTDSIRPAKAHLEKLNSRLQSNIAGGGRASVAAESDILPAMAYPEFEEPLCQRLAAIDPEYIVPNIQAVPENTVTLLKVNNRFVQASLVGANYEMAAELLWREFPTDQRGTYFKQFWDQNGVADLSSSDPAVADIRPIHRWELPNLLGDVKNAPAGTAPEPLVLLLRGDLLKKFPNAVIYAHRAVKKDGLFRLVENPGAADISLPIFQAQPQTDLRLTGFNLTAQQVKSKVPGSGTGGGNRDGWFFIIAEPPGDPRFGMDMSFSPPGDLSKMSWNDLSWENFQIESGAFIKGSMAPANTLTNKVWKTPVKDPDDAARPVEQWGRSSADMAGILLQRPAMVAIHADNLLPKN